MLNPNRNKTDTELKAAAAAVELAVQGSRPDAVRYAACIMPGVLGGEYTVWADSKAVAIGLNALDVNKFRRLCSVDVPGVAP
jgi:hypothetical protein